MYRPPLVLISLWLLVPCRATGGAPTILNGDYEGVFNPQGDDLVPEYWNLVEGPLEPGEISIVTSSSDNGPSLPGTASVEWSREKSAPKGDTSAIYQAFDPPIDVSQLTEPLMLGLDVKAISHDLCGSGWWPTRSEYPVRLKIRFTDENDIVKQWLYGWYIWTGGGCPPPPDGLIVLNGDGIVFSEQIPGETWVSETFDVLAQLRTLTEPKAILSVQVGGAGWNFRGRADNVRFLEGPTALEPGSWGAVKGRYH